MQAYTYNIYIPTFGWFVCLKTRRFIGTKIPVVWIAVKDNKQTKQQQYIQIHKTTSPSSKVATFLFVREKSSRLDLFQGELFRGHTHWNGLCLVEFNPGSQGKPAEPRNQVRGWWVLV